MEHKVLKAHLAKILANGLKTEVTEELLLDYSNGLVKCISDLPLDIRVTGDEDGILVEILDSEAMVLVLPKIGITEFRILGDLNLFSEETNEVCMRVLLMTLGWTLKFFPNPTLSAAPGLTVGNLPEETFSFKDDGFGIT